MKIKPEDLFSGEQLILTKNANAEVSFKAYGLKKIPGHYSNTNEHVGGQLHLTNYRLVFKSHSLNRLRGKFSIFLSTINQVQDVSSFFKKQVQIETVSQDYRFVMWGIPKFRSVFENQKKQLSLEELEDLKSKIAMDFSKVGTGFETFKQMDQMLQSLPKAMEIIQDPLGISSILNILELLDDLNAKNNS